MQIIAWYATPNSKGIMKARKLMRLAGGAFISIGVQLAAFKEAMPVATVATSLTQVVGSTFSPGGPGAAIIQLMLVALVGWLAGYIAQAVGKGQVASMIHITTVLGCVTVVASVAWKAIEWVAKAAGMTL
ncbi:hypothetical protein JCM14036_22930 [Desulfotomaculum defluvii]